MIRAFVLMAVILTMSACASARMHTDAQLNAVAAGCGLSYGEVMQDASERRLLFLMREQPSAGQRACVYQWAHRNHMHLVIIHLSSGPTS